VTDLCTVDGVEVTDLCTVDGVEVTDLCAMDGVAVHKLDRAHSFVVECFEPGSHHVQHVAVRHERAGEVKADGLRLFLWRLAELDDRSVYVAFSDAEHFHSVHERRGVIAAAAATPFNSTSFSSVAKGREREGGLSRVTVGDG